MSVHCICILSNFYGKWGWGLHVVVPNWPYKLFRPYDRFGRSWFGLSWCALTQIRPYHIFMRPTANPALYLTFFLTVEPLTVLQDNLTMSVVYSHIQSPWTLSSVLQHWVISTNFMHNLTMYILGNHHREHICTYLSTFMEMSFIP
jgi:hypothetical protein